MLDLAQIDQLQHLDPDREPDRAGLVEELSSAEIEEQVRACEHWYAQHEASFAGFKGQYIAISFKSWRADKNEMRNIVISPSSLDVTRLFEQRFGKQGGYERRIGDPRFDF